MADISGSGGAGARGKLGPAELIIVIAGVVALLGTFLAWVDQPSVTVGDVTVGGGSANAWSDDLLFPTYAWVGIFGAIMAIHIAITNFGSAKLPRDVLGFTWPQIHLALAFICVLLTFSFLIGGEEQAIGFWLSLLASIALMVGAVMLRNETAGRTI